MTLAYAWSRQLASEVEIYIPKRSTGPRAVSLNFTSTLDGLSYYADLGAFEEVSSTSLLIGLSFLLVPRYGYAMEAALLSLYYVLSVWLIVWRGMVELRKREQPA